ncbi:MAG: DUF1640 domain-containing protein [Nitrospirae bacterium]|nr:DUF1640 domain-containing protein [Nitrospirota bacterium]
MNVIAMPPSVRERLGDEASEGFAALINDIDIGARKDAIAIAEERFERRLVEETGKLRVELRHETGKINERITEETGKLRVEIGKVNERITEETGKLRVEIGKVNERITEETGKLRVEIGKVNERITEETGKLRIEIEKVRSEVEKSGKENIKWMFLFWIGQIAVMLAMFKFIVVK